MIRRIFNLARVWLIDRSVKASCRELARLQDLEIDIQPVDLLSLINAELTALNRLDGKRARILRNDAIPAQRTSLVSDAVLASLIVFAILFAQAEISEHDQPVKVAQQ
jgi:hypothetical protein